ncbi:D-amino-acid oxidase-like [Branchiostoma lanceolatum]|uniref:D-amino-acid oxidase-like n=1 Tax=Branchiostoma lanceolatum TaxID=7740 RepID=UPI0034530BCD
MRVAVVGAGIVGMTSALHIMEQCSSAHGQLELTVMSEKFCPENTSYGAGGLWKPPSQEHMSDAELKRLQGSFDFLTSVLRTSYAHEAGIFLQPGYIVHMDPVPDPAWKDIVVGFRHLTPWELTNLFPGYKQGWFYTCFICQPRDFLPWAKKRLTERGVNFVQRRVDSLEELAPHYDVVVNCSGVGATELASDAAVSASRGQVMRVKAPWLRYFVETDGKHPIIDGIPYMYPNLHNVVIGGIKQTGNFRKTNDPRDTEAIWKGILALNSQMKDAEVVEEWTGFRPMRDGGIRLERETLAGSSTSTGRPLEVVHNYGHGENGVTWSHGCAKEVAEIVKTIMAERSLKSRL